MNVTYTHHIYCACPVDKKKVRYSIVIKSNNMILVEDIIKIISKCEGDEFFQEDITVLLASELKASVHTVGYHSGVRVEVSV